MRPSQGLLVETLQDLDYQVSEAPTARRACAIRSDHVSYRSAPDDIVMPDMNGTNGDERHNRLPRSRAVHNGIFAQRGCAQGRLDHGVSCCQKPVTQVLWQPRSGRFSNKA